MESVWDDWHGNWYSLLFVLSYMFTHIFILSLSGQYCLAHTSAYILFANWYHNENNSD
jgi:hypothetical protein